MKMSTIAGGLGAVALLVLIVAVGAGIVVHHASPSPPPPDDVAPAVAEPVAAGEPVEAPGFLYGRVTTEGGATYEGRLRWGGVEEAFWGDYFNGFKDENPWVDHVPPERLTVSRPIKIFGVPVARHEDEVPLGRPFMTRFGDIARIDADGSDVRVTLKSGTVFQLDRFGANDFDDDVRVWDEEHGVVDLESGVEDLDSQRIRSIELLPTPPLAGVPDRLYGTVRSRHGEFIGFVQWDREESVGTDSLDGYTEGDEVAVRFGTLRSIERLSEDSSRVTLLDGEEIVLAATNDVGEGNRGVYVDDLRYGRVLVSWEAFERLDLRPAGSGPAYAEFPAGLPLRGTLTTRTGRRLVGRLVFDLDEGETTDTLDAPAQGVDYTIPFGLVASIELPGDEVSGAPARVALHNGEELQLVRTGDLGDRNGGLLVFPDGGDEEGGGREGGGEKSGGEADYVPWSEVVRIDLEPPAATYPPIGGGTSLPAPGAAEEDGPAEVRDAA